MGNLRVIGARKINPPSQINLSVLATLSDNFRFRRLFQSTFLDICQINVILTQRS